eukprot:CAMPEP_0113441192 /NCGR_PEP_ID=MMETSP0014_2-20120614/950_1 /TAXON_ID=2857 /ORGANISM="Nitzschia sp." /LENGTH=253 /DNA_ID=CAMNT_0000332017 /DNA_START=147 /DNA_END=908 /DNA_ORIENTATION=+ /assembly_acc=CAM_ASM_000159
MKIQLLSGSFLLMLSPVGSTETTTANGMLRNSGGSTDIIIDEDDYNRDRRRLAPVDCPTGFFGYQFKVKEQSDPSTVNKALITSKSVAPDQCLVQCVTDEIDAKGCLADDECYTAEFFFGPGLSLADNLRELQLEITGSKDFDGSTKYINLDYHDFESLGGGDGGVTSCPTATGCSIHFCEGDITEVVCTNCLGEFTVFAIPSEAPTLSQSPSLAPTKSPVPTESPSEAPTKTPKSQKRERKRRSLVARSMTE